MEGNMDRQSITNTLASNIKFLRINTKVEKFDGKSYVWINTEDLANLYSILEQAKSKM